MQARHQVRSSESRPMRVVVTDDHPLILEAITRILHSADHHVVGTCSNSRELLSLLAHEKVDAVTLDIGMPGLNGIDLARQVRAGWPAVRIVFVSQQTDAVYVRAAFAAGASAFVAKQASTTVLNEALKSVGLGRQYVTPGLLDLSEGMQAALQPRHRRKGQENQDLTTRQREVLQLIAEGKAVKEIASALDISVKTVEFHKQALMSGLNLRTTAELTRYAIAQGLVFL